MQINIINTQKDLSLSFSSAKSVADFLLSHLKVKCDEVSFHFVTTRKICKLHADFFNDPTTTDCITFPIDPNQTPGYRILGEVFICPATAINYCNENSGDPYEETTLYLVHGLLHLLGYDDIDPIDRRKMKRKERACMALIKKHNLLLDKKKVV